MPKTAHARLDALDDRERDDLERLLADLISTPSVNPWIVGQGITTGLPIGTGAGEQKVAELLAGWLNRVDGVDVSVEEVADARPNVVVRIPGTGRGRSLCIAVHTDTVDCVAWPEQGFVPRLKGDRMYGLGAADNKGQCAALAMTVARLAANPPEGEVIAAFTVGEEGPSIGAHHLVESVRTDGAVVLEPAGIGRATVATAGFASMDVVVRTSPAHSCVDDAPDAGVQMAAIIQGLARHRRETLSGLSHPSVGRPYFHTSWLKGGTDYGTFPAELTLGLEMGTLPGESAADRVAETEAVIEEVRKDHPDLDAEVRVALEAQPFEAEGHDGLLAAYGEATRAVTGKGLETNGFNAWTDASITQAAGIPTILAGGDGGGFHAVDEWVSVSSLAQLVPILEGAAHRFCV